MKRIAFVFSHAPHGSSGGREGLDAALATSALSDEIALFFVSDGVLQLTSGQRPEQILARNYVATFGVLPLYDVDRCYLCAAALAERGLSDTLTRVLDAEVLPPAELSALLHQYDRILVF